MPRKKKVSVGRPAATGRFETRKELERTVIKLRKNTILTLEEIAVECATSIFPIWRILRDNGLTRDTSRNRATVKPKNSEKSK